MGNIAYQEDVIAWSREQARLLRDGQWARLDIEHLADEIEDVGKSESRELESRMTILIAHLLKWSVQAERRTRSWENTIKEQRNAIAIRVRKTPSLKAEMREDDFRTIVWLDARALLRKETGIEDWPPLCPITLEDALRDDFWSGELPA